MPETETKPTSTEGWKPWMTFVISLIGAIGTTFGGHYVLGRNNVTQDQVPSIIENSPYAKDKPDIESNQVSFSERIKALENENKKLTDQIKKLEKAQKNLEARMGS